MISKGTHVKFVRFVLLAVSEKAKTWLPGLLRTLTEQDIEKIVEDITRTHKTQKRSTKVAKELFADYMKEKQLREPEEKRELAQTLETFYVEVRKKEFVQSVTK